jgi:hypothetical protein
MQRVQRAKREEAMGVRRRLSVHWASQIAIQLCILLVCILLGLAVFLHSVPAGEVPSPPGEEMRSGAPFSEAAPDSLSAALSRVLRIIAIAHGALLILAGGVFVGRRLLVGAWWIQRTSTSTSASDEAGEQEG